jgi:hypothetical protein
MSTTRTTISSELKMSIFRGIVDIFPEIPTDFLATPKKDQIGV